MMPAADETDDQTGEAHSRTYQFNCEAITLDNVVDTAYSEDGQTVHKLADGTTAITAAGWQICLIKGN